jgi:hypothetical protein
MIPPPFSALFPSIVDPVTSKRPRRPKVEGEPPLKRPPPFAASLSAIVLSRTLTSPPSV